MKKKIDTLNATPSKRTFLSIIADYDLNRSICELVDNGLDVWVRGGRGSKISIAITLNLQQQTIRVAFDHTQPASKTYHTVHLPHGRFRPNFVRIDAA